MTETGPDWSVDLLRGVLDVATEGVVICEATGDRPVVYANAAFAQLSGFEAAELIGANLRRLQGTQHDQEGLRRLRDALARAEPCRVVVHNFRKDGTAFWNEISLRPLAGPGGRVTHFVGFHREVIDRPRSGERPATGLPSWIRDDRLSGLASSAYFDEVLQREWAAAQRLAHELTLFSFDIDHLGAYNETFQKGGGDSCIRRVAHVIGVAFRRSSDFVARLEGGAFQVLVPGMAADAADAYARDVAQRVYELHIHHPRAANRFVTVSVGIATLAPPRDASASLIVEAARSALERAKSAGRNRVVTADLSDAGQRPGARAPSAGVTSAIAPKAG
jgi:diguanylate cyclase (GGDEF)-like protein/PAS domain S-box-containing protein